MVRYIKKKLEEESIEHHEIKFLKRELETISSKIAALKMENTRLREEYNKLSDLHLIYKNDTNYNNDSDASEDNQ